MGDKETMKIGWVYNWLKFCIRKKINPFLTFVPIEHQKLWCKYYMKWYMKNKL